MGETIRHADQRARETRLIAGVAACDAWNYRMEGYGGPPQRWAARIARLVPEPSSPKCEHAEQDQQLGAPRQSRKKNSPAQPGGLEICPGGVSAALQPPLDINWNTRNRADDQLGLNRAVHMSNVGSGRRANSMLDVAAGILGLASVGIFVAHAVDAYRAQ